MDYGRREPQNYLEKRETGDTGRTKGRREESANADEALETLANEMDRAMTGDALIIADLFRTAAQAAVILPKMKLHTGLFDVIVDDDSILVKIERPKKKESKGMMDFTNEFHSSQAKDRGYEEDSWYDENDEEREYDED